jgi:hypothetical protein
MKKYKTKYKRTVTYAYYTSKGEKENKKNKIEWWRRR